MMRAAMATSVLCGVVSALVVQAAHSAGITRTGDAGGAASRAGDATPPNFNARPMRFVTPERSNYMVTNLTNLQNFTTVLLNPYCTRAGQGQQMWSTLNPPYVAGNNTLLALYGVNSMSGPSCSAIGNQFFYQMEFSGKQSGRFPGVASIVTSPALSMSDGTQFMMGYCPNTSPLNPYAQIMKQDMSQTYADCRGSCSQGLFFEDNFYLRCSGPYAGGLWALNRYGRTVYHNPTFTNINSLIPLGGPDNLLLGDEPLGGLQAFTKDLKPVWSAYTRTFKSHRQVGVDTSTGQIYLTYYQNSGNVSVVCRERTKGDEMFNTTLPESAYRYNTVAMVVVPAVGVFVKLGDSWAGQFGNMYMVSGKTGEILWSVTDASQQVIGSMLMLPRGDNGYVAYDARSKQGSTKTLYVRDAATGDIKIQHPLGSSVGPMSVLGNQDGATFLYLSFGYPPNQQHKLYSLNGLYFDNL